MHFETFPQIAQTSADNLYSFCESASFADTNNFKLN